MSGFYFILSRTHKIAAHTLYGHSYAINRVARLISLYRSADCLHCIVAESPNFLAIELRTKNTYGFIGGLLQFRLFVILTARISWAIRNSESQSDICVCVCVHIIEIVLK